MVSPPKYYKIKIVSQGAPTQNPDDPNKHTFDVQTKNFGSLEEVKKFLAENYPKKRGKDIFVDKTDGSVEKVGKVFSFWNADYSHAPVEKWWQSDWVEVTEVAEARVVKGLFGRK